VTAVTRFEPAAGLAAAAAARAPAAATTVAAPQRQHVEAGTPHPSEGGGRPHRSVVVVVVERRGEGRTGSRGRVPRVRTPGVAVRDGGRCAVARPPAPPTHRGDAHSAPAIATVTGSRVPSDHAPAKTAEACDTIAVTSRWVPRIPQRRGRRASAGAPDGAPSGARPRGRGARATARPTALAERTVAPRRSAPGADASTIGRGRRGARISPRRPWRRRRPARCGRGAAARGRGPGATQCTGGGRRHPTGGRGPRRPRRRPSAVAPPPRRQCGCDGRSGPAAAAAAVAAGKTRVGFPHGCAVAAVEACPPLAVKPSSSSRSAVGWAWERRPTRRSRRRRHTAVSWAHRGAVGRSLWRRQCCAGTTARRE